jgi:hypothetical protein
MENKISLKKNVDARIVPPVRKLQSNKTIEQSLEARKNQEEKPLILPKINTNFNTNNKDFNNISNIPKTKKLLTPLDNTKNAINNNTNNQNNLNETNTTSNKNTLFKNESSKTSSINKISIDGSMQKPNTSSTIGTTKAFNYDTLKKYKKRKKSEYQKNLLSKESIDKYKVECVDLIKKELEIKNLLAKIGIVKDDDFLLYITNTFFTKPHFLFSLEMVILENVEESGKLKVFRNNKKVLPLKVVKEKFFKDEIIKDLKLKIYEGEYSNKFNNLMKSLDMFINNLKNEEM